MIPNKHHSIHIRGKTCFGLYLALMGSFKQTKIITYTITLINMLILQASLGPIQTFPQEDNIWEHSYLRKTSIP